MTALKFKILACTIYDFPHIGGASSHLQSLQKMMLAENVGLDILSWSNVSPSLKLISRIPGLFGAVNIGFISRLRIIFSTEIKIKIFSYLIKRILKNRSYDILNPQSVFAMNACLNCDSAGRLPKVLTVHGYAAYEARSAGAIHNDKEMAYFIELEKRAYSNADLILAVDSRIRKHILSLSPTSKGKTEVWVNSVDKTFIDSANWLNKGELRKKFGFSQDSFIVLCPRRLVPKNGVLVALRALPLMERQIKDIRLLFAGDGMLKRTMIEMIPSYLKKSAMFLGDIEHTRMAELYAMSDVVIIPSLPDAGVEEATSIASLEAAAMGVPLVVSDIGGLRELYENTGAAILVEPNDITALAQSVIKIKEDKRLSEMLKENAKQLVLNKYSPQIWAENYLKFISRFIES